MLIIAGAQKSGTTTLFDTLERHPDIHGCRHKEPQFLCLASRTVEQHLEWYRGLFDEHEKGSIWMEGSTFYLFSPHTPALIKKHIQDPYIVVILRDPAKRAYSSFLHMQKKVPTRERRNFDEVLGRLEKTYNDVEDLETAENVLTRSAVSCSEIDRDYLGKDYHHRLPAPPFVSTFSDRLFVYRYFSGSLYSRLIEPYKENFPGRLKIIFFEEFIRSPGDVLQEVMDFAGLACFESLTDLEHSNETRVPRNRSTRQALWIRQKILESKFIKKYVKSGGLIQEFLTPLDRVLKERIFKKPKDGLTKVQYQRARSLLEREYNFWMDRYPKLSKLWRY